MALLYGVLHKFGKMAASEKDPANLPLKDGKQEQKGAIDDMNEEMLLQTQLQAQLDQHAAFPNEDPRDRESATRGQPSRSHRNGFAREANDRWPFQLHDRPGDPIVPRKRPSVEDWQRDTVIPYLANKTTSEEEARAFLQQEEDAFIAKIRREQTGEELDDTVFCL